MEKKTKNEFEMLLMTVCFVLLCAAVLLSVVLPWGMEAAGYCYAMIALLGVITCARKKVFMAVDSLLDLYPVGVRSAVKKVRDILMLAVFAVLFAVSILGTVRQLQEPTYSAALGIPNLILYLVSVVVYPAAALFYFRAMKQDKEV